MGDSLKKGSMERTFFDFKHYTCNALTTISGNAQVWNEKASDAVVKEKLNKIIRHSNRIGAISEKFLNELTETERGIQTTKELEKKEQKEKLRQIEKRFRTYFSKSLNPRLKKIGTTLEELNEKQEENRHLKTMSKEWTELQPILEKVAKNIEELNKKT